MRLLGLGTFALSAVALWAQPTVSVEGGRVVYTRCEGDRAFNANGIGYPPKGVDPGLWYAYDRHIKAMAERKGVDPVLVKAIIYCESRFHWQATSKAKARGLMQVIDSTAVRLGGVSNARGLGSYDPIDNISMGVDYLSQLQTRYQGNLIKIAAAYNAGEGAVDRHGGIPPYKETKAYVPAVLWMWAQINQGR